MSGRIVILNGAPRSGKSSIAAALQQDPDHRWINLGVDAQNRALPPALLPGIGLRPGGERPDLESAVASLFEALYHAVAAHARAGFDVVVDVGHHDHYSRPLGILTRCAGILVDFDVLFVGIHCPFDTIMARRRADQQDGFYAVDPAPVQRWQQAIHAGHAYDLVLDTAILSPADCSAAIAQALRHPPVPSAFVRLAAS